jgi:hypothetical protein
MLNVQKSGKQQLPPIDGISMYFSSKYIPNAEIVMKQGGVRGNQREQSVPILTNNAHRLLETLKKYCQT